MQAQTDKQRRQTGQRPTDRRAVGKEEQRRQQIEEGQTEAGQHRQAFALPRQRLLRQGVAQLVETEQQRHAEHQRAQRRTFQQAAFAEPQLTEERQRRTQLQQQCKGARQRSLLTQSEPENPGAFHRPSGRCPARIKPQRDRQTGEDHAQRQTGFR
ncbi:hypothetical protein D3C84_601990 [compost metagenome]